MIYAFLSVIVYVLSAVIVSRLMQNIPPLTIIFLFEIGALVGATVALSFMRHFKTGFQEVIAYRKQVVPLVCFGVLDALGWFFSVYYNGLSGHAILSRLISIVLISYGVFFLKERLSSLQAFACTIMIGAAFLYAFQVNNTNDIFGIFFICLQIIGYCAFSIQQKKLAHNIDPFMPLLLRSATLVTITAPIILLEGRSFLVLESAGNLSYSYILLAFLGGICGAVLNHAFTMKAYKYERIAIVTAIRSLNSIILFLVGVVFYQEELKDEKLLAAFMMLTGIALIIIDRFKPKIQSTIANRIGSKKLD